METRRSRKGETIDHVAFRHYGHNNMLEQVISANPQLATAPIVLNEGTEVKMPEVEQVKTRTRLW